MSLRMHTVELRGDQPTGDLVLNLMRQQLRFVRGVKDAADPRVAKKNLMLTDQQAESLRDRFKVTAWTDAETKKAEKAKEKDGSS